MVQRAEEETGAKDRGQKKVVQRAEDIKSGAKGRMRRRGGASVQAKGGGGGGELCISGGGGGRGGGRN